MIRKAAVIGAGAMGSGIAALLAGVGVKTYLLDIVPTKLTDEEQKKSLTLKDPQVRNRIAFSAIERLKKAQPAAFFVPEDAALITPGNIEDNLSWLGEVDWIIEAVYERLDIKR